MTVLISGGCKNGKSSLAQDLALEYAKKTGRNPIYFATMIPQDSEDDARVEKHRADRRGLGFQTIECGKNLTTAIKNMEEGRVVLFDSLTALLANELFSPDSVTQKGEFVIPLGSEYLSIAKKVQTELSNLIKKSDSVIFVSDEIFCDGKIYDETTELYRKILAQTENFIAGKCDRVIEMVSKRKIEIKNERADGQTSKLSAKEDSSQAEKEIHLIIGGAYQGKEDWAREEFSLLDEDIFVCDSDSMPDFSKKCLTHYENYVAYCLKQNLSPQTDFSDSTVIICDDIFCGVVPIDAFQRKWREETGLTLQKIAAQKNVILWRVFCGRAVKIQ